MLGTVAHDLKNPLGVILGRTEMLTELTGAGSSRESVTPRSSISATPPSG